MGEGRPEWMPLAPLRAFLTPYNQAAPVASELHGIPRVPRSFKATGQDGYINCSY